MPMWMDPNHVYMDMGKSRIYGPLAFWLSIVFLIIKLKATHCRVNTLFVGSCHVLPTYFVAIDLQKTGWLGAREVLTSLGWNCTKQASLFVFCNSSYLHNGCPFFLPRPSDSAVPSILSRHQIFRISMNEYFNSIAQVSQFKMLVLSCVWLNSIWHLQLGEHNGLFWMCA